MWRQGDVFIVRVPAIPDTVRQRPLPHGVLVHGEVTGHSHRLENLLAATLYAGQHQRGEVFIEVKGRGSRVVHEEHGAIDLAPGFYRAWRQREYSPQEIRIVRD